MTARPSAQGAERQVRATHNRFGVTLPGSNLRDNIQLARAAEQRGAASVWVIETRLTTDAVVPMAVYASATARVHLASGVIPLWTRNPALIAQTFATLDMLAPGRIILGLGAWWEPLASRTGVERRKPIRAMREVVESVRLLLAREGPVDYDGEFVHMDGLFLDHGAPGSHDVKVYIAAVGPQMLRLAGRIADGVVLNVNHTVGAVRRSIAEVKAGAESAGRSLDEIDRVKLLPVVVTNDKKRALDRAKPGFALYLAQQPHIEGPAEVEPALAERARELIPWPATRGEQTDAAALIPDEVVEKLGCYGDADEVRGRLRLFREAGVTTPVVGGATDETMAFMSTL